MGVYAVKFIAVSFLCFKEIWEWWEVWYGFKAGVTYWEMEMIRI